MLIINNNIYAGWAPVLLIVIIVTSCKRETLPSPALASLTVTNVLVSGKSIRVNNIITEISSNGTAQLAVPIGENSLYVWPVGDSSSPYYASPKFTVDDRDIYSFFLAGQTPTATGIILKDDMPFHKDSTCGVRFINLSPNSPPLNITFSTTPLANEVNNLGYLQYTDFKLYPAKVINASYSIQIRKASDNTVLLTYTLATPRFTNVTLVIRGLVNGTAPQNLAITRVNNDR